MSKSEFISVLSKNGLEAIEENGVVVVLYEGGMSEFEKAFSKALHLAKLNGYANSLGARAKKGGSHETSDKKTV